MNFTILSKRQLTTIKEYQAVIDNKPPACLAALYECNRKLVAKYNRHKHHKTDINGPSILQTMDSYTTARFKITFTYNHLSKTLPDNNTGSDHLANTRVDNIHENKQPLDGYYYFHVSSKSHVDAHILERDEVKKIFENECIHYARVFEIAITNYCIMDNHFHLKIGVPAQGISFEEARKRCAKAVGCMKQQFTNRFKVWYNVEYRREKGHRIPKLGGGSMWAGSLHITYIHDDAYQEACTLYVEANRIKISGAKIIEQLDTSPQTTTQCLSERFGLNNGYDELITQLLNNKFQSAQAYLNEELRPNTALTDGCDGVWATPEEVEKLWHTPAHKLPSGHRKVHVNQERRILKQTPTSQRTYHTTPFIKRLGQTPEIRQQNFAQRLLQSCWKNRQSSCSGSTEKTAINSEPGVQFYP